MRDLSAIQPDQEYFIVAPDSHFKAGEFSDFLNNIAAPHRIVSGGYRMQEGPTAGEYIHEQSFLIDARFWELVRNSGMINDQESVLWLGHFDYASHTNGRPAELRFLSHWNDGRQDLGVFREVTRERAYQEDGFTKRDDKYFSCVSRAEIARNPLAAVFREKPEFVSRADNYSDVPRDYNI